MGFRSNNGNLDTHPMTKIRILVFTTSLLILVVFGIAGYKYIWLNLINTDSPKVVKEKINNTYEELSNISSASDGQKYLDDKVKKSTSNEETAQIYIMKSAAADTVDATDNKAKALEYAYKAEKIYPSNNSALMIAGFEEYRGNKEVALKYYKLCVERAPKDSSEWTLADTTYYNNIIKKLEAELKK